MYKVGFVVVNTLCHSGKNPGVKDHRRMDLSCV